MQGFGLILREQVLQRFGFSAMRADISLRPRGWYRRLLIFIIAAVAMVALECFYVWLVYWLAKVLSAARLGRALLFGGLSVTMLSTLAMGTVMLLSVLYFNKDAEALAALPVPFRTVFTVKITLTYLSECAVSIPLVWPVFILYGIFEKVGALFYIKAVVVWLCALSLPILLASLITLPLMRWTALWKRRDLVAVVGGLCLLVAYMCGQMWLSTRMADMITGDVLIRFLLGKVDLFERIASAIPPLGMSLNALTKTGGASLGSLAGLAGLSLILTAAALALAGRIYMAGVLAQMETHKSGRAVSWKRVSFSERSPRTALLIREFSLIARTPIYAINTLAVLVVFPLLLLMPLFGSAAMMSDPDMRALMSFFTSFTDTWTVALVCAGACTLMGALNPALSTSVSREGKQFFWSKVMPVPYETQAEAKLIMGVLYAWFVGALLSISLAAGVKLPAAGVALGYALSLPLAFPAAALALCVDIMRPKLSWSNTTEAIKQNMNVLLGMLTVVVYMAILTAAAWLLLSIRTPSYIVYIGACIVAAASCAGSVVMLRAVSRLGYARVEA